MLSNLLDEIKQTKPFARPSSEAFLSILRTATVLEHEQNEALRPHGLTLTQYNVLRILKGAGKGGLCGRAIAERLISKVPDVSRLLDRMDDMDLIERERDPDDRRHVTARISARGRRLLVQAGPDLEVLEQKRFRSLPPKAVASLVKALAAVRGSVDAV
jgi:DNA-binding MarR family transcriptional regulator